MKLGLESGKRGTGSVFLALILSGCSLSTAGEELYDPNPSRVNDAGPDSAVTLGPPVVYYPGADAGKAVTPQPEADAGSPQPETDAGSGSPPQGCVTYEHSDAVGQAWTDCTAPGTFSQAEATEACMLYAQARGNEYGSCAAGQTTCSPIAGPGPGVSAGGVLVQEVCYFISGSCGGYCWDYGTGAVGSVQSCNCVNVGGWQ